MFGFFERHQQPPRLDRRRSLAGVPVLNEGVSAAPAGERGLQITVRCRRGGRWWSRFQPPYWERVIRLDELGSFVFRQVDNRRPTAEIIAAFAARYRVNRRAAALSTVSFLKSLAQRGVISIVVR